MNGAQINIPWSADCAIGSLARWGIDDIPRSVLPARQTQQTLLPLQARVVRTLENSVEFAVNKGYVNGNTPTLAGAPISAENAVFSVAFGASATVYVKVSDSVAAAEIIAAQGAIPADTEDAGYFKLADIQVSQDGEASINNYLSTSQATSHCGQYWIRWVV